jgi:hypothetical protein
MIQTKPHFFLDVPGLGSVAFTWHALARLKRDGVTDEQLADTLLNGTDTPDSGSIIWRRWQKVRLVIETQPRPNKGAKVVVTGYRESAQHSVNRHHRQSV